VIDLQISVARQPGGTVMAVAGELDLASTGELEARLSQRDVADGDLVMDLSELSFIDASGLHALVTAHRGALQRGHRFSVARTSPPLERLLALTGARDLLGLTDVPA
jgi:anti-anti-sigma factor